MLIYTTVNGTRVAARPSGTEPKIKFYFSVHAPLDKIENAKKVEDELDNMIKNIIEDIIHPVVLNKGNKRRTISATEPIANI